MITIVETHQKSMIDIKNSILTLMENLDYVPSKSRILLKPNIVDAITPNNPTITHPKVVGGIILALNEKGAKEFVIGENSGFFSFKEEHFQRLLNTTKYEQTIKQLKKNYDIDVRAENLEFTEFDDYNWKFGILKLPYMCKTHAYINIPKMKSHLMTGATLCMKNQKGLLQLSEKKQFHLGYGNITNIHECIREFSKIIQPELNIVDATTALEDTGPAVLPEGQTKTRKLNLCIGGYNMAEVDNACLKIMGISLDEAKHIPYKKIELATKSLPIIPANPPFQKPNKYIKYGNILSYCSDKACTGCQMVYSRIFRKLSFNPELMQKYHDVQKFYPKIEFYIGKQEIDKIEKNVIPKVFFGQCTKKDFKDYLNRIQTLPIEEKPEIIHISGCSADHNEGIKAILNLKKLNKKSES